MIRVASVYDAQVVLGVGLLCMARLLARGYLREKDAFFRGLPVWNDSFFSRGLLFSFDTLLIYGANLQLRIAYSCRVCYVFQTHSDRTGFCFCRHTFKCFGFLWVDGSPVHCGIILGFDTLEIFGRCLSCNDTLFFCGFLDKQGAISFDGILDLPAH